jgi:hypothetical protein
MGRASYKDSICFEFGRPGFLQGQQMTGAWEGERVTIIADGWGFGRTGRWGGGGGLTLGR